MPQGRAVIVGSKRAAMDGMWAVALKSPAGHLRILDGKDGPDVRSTRTAARERAKEHRRRGLTVCLVRLHIATVTIAK